MMVICVAVPLASPPSAGDVFRLNAGPHSSKGLVVSASFFEIYCSKVYDLLNNKQRLRTLEDAQGRVRVSQPEHGGAHGWPSD